MTAETENLVLHHLREMRAWQDRADNEFREIKSRLGDLTHQVIGVRRDQVIETGTVATMQVRLDRLGDRLDRIERRLELRDE